MSAAWHEFYVLLGTAAAALVALMFVAASVAAGLISAAQSTATRTFMSPIIFHYTCVLFLSLMALVSDLTERRLAVIVALVAVFGFGFSIMILIGVMRSAVADVPTASAMARARSPLMGQRWLPPDCCGPTRPRVQTSWPARSFFCFWSTSATPGT